MLTLIKAYVGNTKPIYLKIEGDYSYLHGKTGGLINSAPEIDFILNHTINESSAVIITKSEFTKLTLTNKTINIFYEF